MAPPGCPEFEYAHLHQAVQLLSERSGTLVRGLVQGTISRTGGSKNTRPHHGILFAGLTPIGHAYFAGHYRGEGYACLREYRVFFGGREGAKPGHVMHEMRELASFLDGAFNALDMRGQEGVQTEEFVMHAAQLAADAFQRFLTIHPYANGNGHMGRFVVWAIFTRYGYIPQSWTIDPRPNFSKYEEMIEAHRRGDCEQLEQAILRSLIRAA